MFLCLASAPRSTDLSCALFVRVPPPVLPAREQQAFRPDVPSTLHCFWGVSVLTELCRTQPSLLSLAAAHPGRLPHVELLPAGTRHLALSMDLITERSEENFRKEVELFGVLMLVFSPVWSWGEIVPDSFTWCQHGVLWLRGKDQSLL